MQEQNILTELKNLSPFPRTDVAKLGFTRKISGISIEKSGKIEFFKTFFFNFQNRFFDIEIGVGYTGSNLRFPTFIFFFVHLRYSDKKYVPKATNFREN